MRKQWKWLVVGGGSIGCRHLRNLRLLGQRNITLMEPAGERAAVLGKELQVPVVDSLKGGLQMQPDVAIICSPTRFHLSQASECLNAGCALFVEKPLSDQWAGINAFLSKAASRGARVLVGCNFRFHPGIQALQRLLKQGVMGKLVSIRAEFGYFLPSWHPWEDYRKGYSANKHLGGGVALDRIHEFDLLRLLGGEIRNVTGRCRNTHTLEIDTEDLVQAEIAFASGAWGTLQLDYLRRTYRCVIEVLGTEGHATWDYSKASLTWSGSGRSREQTRTWPDWDANDMYLDEMKHFFRVLVGKAVPEQDANKAAEILKWVLKIKTTGEKQ